MLKLKNEFEQSGGKWKEFKLDQLFEKIKTKTLKYKVKELPVQRDSSHDLPALTAGILNQGLSCYVPKSKATILRNVISVSANGANSGAMFYQPNDFTILQDSYAIRPKTFIPTQKQYLYILSALQKTIRGNYNWVNKAGWERIKGEGITLPVYNGKIAVDYMERYISELEEERISELAAYLKITGLENYVLTKPEKITLKSRGGGGNLRKFKIGDLFNGKTGDIDLQQKDVNNRGHFFINSGIQNLGIKGKTDRNARVFPKNTITIDFWGNAFYRDFDYKLATHNHVFSLSGDIIKNRKVGIYLSASMSFMTSIFSYNNMGTWNKIKELYIFLPTDKFGIPDYEFMENYISAQEKLVIKNLIEWKDRIIETTKRVIKK